MQWLVVLDSVEGLNPKTDTSLALINQGRENCVRVDTATIDKLFFYKQASVIAEDLSGVEHSRNLCDYDLILTPLPVDQDNLSIVPLFREPVKLVLPSEHRLASKKRIARKELSGESVLTIEEHHHFHQQIQQPQYLRSFY